MWLLRAVPLKRLWLLLALSPFGSQAFARNTACAPRVAALVSQISEARTSPAVSTSQRQLRLRAAQDETSLFAENSFQEFMKGVSLPLASCLGREEVSSLLTDAIGAAFYNKTVEVLESGSSKNAQDFARAIRSRFGSTYLPGFNVFAEWNDSLPALPAGFNRGNSTVYFRLSGINKAQWFVYFIHEMAHALDADLSEAEALHARSTTLAGALSRWSPSADLSPSLPLDARAFAWVDLARGYLSEVKAWKTTLEVVQSLPETEVPASQLSFLEDPFGPESRWPLSHEDVHAVLFQRFKSPSTGLYSNVQLRNEFANALNEMNAAFSLGWNAVAAQRDSALLRIREFCLKAGD